MKISAYKKNVATGKGILIFAIIFAIIIRIVYFFNFDFSITTVTYSYLWSPLSSLFKNPLVSLISSSVFTAALAVIASHINTKYVFIRQKTLLPSAIIILLFSCQPLFILMSAEYISVLLFLFILSILFASYNEGHQQVAAFKVSFFLTLGSLYTPVLIVYIPALWISLAMMRCFNLKSILASLLAVFVIYFPTFSYYLFTDHLDLFVLPFTSITEHVLSNLYFFKFEIIHWIVWGFLIIFLGIIISNNYINRHKDKIKNRAYLAVLCFITVLAMLIFLLLNVMPDVSLYIALVTGGLLAAHFFALPEGRGVIFLFYLSIFFYLAICFSPFFILFN